MESDRVRVLLVDDDPDFLEICASQISTADERIDVQTAISGEECLERVDAGSFDVVLADYWMQPGMTGLQLLSSLRERGHEVPFIFLTARGNEGVAAEALRLGADDYVVKGVERAGYAKLARSVLEASDRFNLPSGMPEPGLRLPPRAPAATARRYDLLRAVLEEVPVGILVMDREGAALAGNRRLCELLGIASADLEAWLRELWERPDQRLGDAAAIFRGMIDDGAPIEHLEFELNSADGRPLRLQARGRAIPSASGDRAGFVLALQDVADERRAEDALRSSMRQVRDDFDRYRAILEQVMSTLSHDLKTPLVSIAGFADLLRDPARRYTDEERRDKLARIARNAQKMHAMIEELLELRPTRPPGTVEPGSS